MKFLSVCSGIEAASQAWGPLDWKPVAFAEIEPFPCAVLAHHYPHVPNWGDMTKFKDWPDVSIDLLCGGTPCQSFSVAGLRKGLDDPRGNLMLTFGAIAAKYRPRWLVWENVAGVLSSDEGRDFASLLGLLSGQVIDVPRGGWSNSGIIAGIPDAYGLAYRVLDAQYVRVESHPRAVPQRRRRVFVVGYLGDWRRAAAVLFERESLSGHPAPRREAGARSAVGALAGTSPGGGWRVGADEAAAGQLVVGTLQANGKAAGSATQQDAESGLLIAHSLRGEGFDASEDGTGRGTPLVPIAFDTTQITSAANRSNPRPGDPCHTLAKGQHAPAIAFDCMASGMNGFGIGEIANPQRVGTNSSGAAHQAVQQGMQVRRLTPLETERLMGFKDGWTAIHFRGKSAADGNRYKSHGNSWAINVATWVGERIALVNSIQSPDQTPAAPHAETGTPLSPVIDARGHVPQGN